MRLRLFLLIMTLMASMQYSLAQSLNVEGTVQDTKGEAVIGATVRVKGNLQKGALTDMNGKFAIKGLKATDVLQVTYVGMVPQDVKVKPRLSITLESDVHMLEDAVVVAFGKQKKEAFTGSATVVDAKKLELRQINNAMDALSGQVAGVQMINNSGSPSSTPSILVRGISSINAGTSPLIVVDGAPYDGGWNNINPADIESITVQKDAASNALYGARGANGVIMITTKSASKNEAKISLDAKWGVNSRGSKLYETIDNPAQYYETHYKALYNYFANNKGDDLYTAHVKANETLGQTASTGGLAYLLYSAPMGEYLIGENGKLNPNAVLGNRVYNNGNYYTLLPDNWVDNAYRTALRQEYNVNINGGNEKSQFYASLGYLKSEGIVKHSDYERYTARMKANYQARKWMKVGGNINFAHGEQNTLDNSESTNLFSMLTTMAPIYPLYIRDANGNVMRDDNGLMFDYGDGAVNGLVRPVLSQNNPLQTNVLDTRNSSTRSWSLNGFTDITPLEGLKVTLNGSATERETRSIETVAPFYGYGAANYPGGMTSVSQSRILSLNFQQLANYTRSFGKHTMTLLLGHEYYATNTQSVSGSKKDMANYWDNQELAGAITTISTTSGTSKYNTEGYFFRGMYEWGDRYYGNLSYRRDASSNFHPDHRWGDFYSLGGAWIMTKENWMKGIKWLDMLKLKTSFGQQGNDAIGSFRYTDVYNIGSVAGEIGLLFSSKGTKNISWETNTNINIGVEFEVFKKRLSGSIEYFYRKTTDMLSYVTDPLSSGHTGHYENIGDMLNTGIELELRATPVRTKDFTWDLNLNLTHYKNEVTALSSANKSSTFNGHKGQQSGNYFIGEGFPRYTWLLPQFMGVNENGQALYVEKNSSHQPIKNADGSYQLTTKVSNAAYMQCGSPTPDFYGGFGTSARYKGFDMNITMGFSVGGKVFDSGYYQLMQMPTEGATGKALHKDLLNAWSPSNMGSDVPRLQFNDINNNGMNSRYLTDGSYLSLQSVNLGYTLPARWLKPMQISSLRVYIGGENLFYLSARKGLDPRSTSTFNGYVSAAHYSITRNVTFGLSLKF